MSGCADQYAAMEKAREEWQKAKRNTAEKRQTRTDKAVLCLVAELAMGLTASGGLLMAKAATTAVQAVQALALHTAGGVSYLTAALGRDEADRAYQNAVEDEGVAFGRYLVAKLHWCQCRRAHASPTLQMDARG